MKKSLKNERFGRLFVLDGPYKEGSRFFWRCLCDCGTIVRKREDHLEAGDTTSCGCLKAEMDKTRVPKMNQARAKYGHSDEAAFVRLLRMYRRNAKITEREFGLTNEQFRSLTSATCHYCGVPPSCTLKVNVYGEPYRYNGIDRINNNVGYVLSNRTTACDMCNTMKGTYSQETFLKQVQQVASQISGGQ